MAQLWYKQYGDRRPRRMKMLCHTERRVLSRQAYVLGRLLSLGIWCSSASSQSYVIPMTCCQCARASEVPYFTAAVRPRWYNLDTFHHLLIAMTVVTVMVIRQTSVFSWWDCSLHCDVYDDKLFYLLFSHFVHENYFALSEAAYPHCSWLPTITICEGRILYDNLSYYWPT